MNDWFQVITYILTAAASLLAAGWFSALWIARLRDDIKEAIHEKIEKLEQNIVRKLEYHEQHDDKRFSEIRKEIIDLRIREAKRDGFKIVRATARDDSDSDS
jgi:hypothetical protein